MSEAKADIRSLVDRRTMSLLVGAFWALTLFVTPLMLAPGALTGSLQALRETTAFRAILLGFALVFGLSTYMAVSPTRFSELLSRRSLRRPWLVALLLLVSWVLLSTFFHLSSQVEPGLGAQGRMDGTLIQAAWFSLAAVSCGIARESRIRATTIIWLVVASATVTSVWAYLQALGSDPLTQITGLYLDIPAGAFGHGALASAYIAFVTLVAASTWSSQDRIGVGKYSIFLVLGVGLAATGGRAALAGLLIGALTLTISVIGRRRKELKRLLVWAALFGVGMMLPLLTVERAQARFEQTASAFVGGDPTLNTRVAAWSGGSRLLFANSLFGVGPGGFGFEVWNYLEHEQIETMLRDPLGSQLAGVDLKEGDYVISGDVVAFLDASGAPVISRMGWDKAHNYFLDLGLMFGVPAVIFLLAFVVSGELLLWRSRTAFTRGVAVAWISFLIFGLAWFGTISLDPIIWVLVGAGIGIGLREAATGRVRTASPITTATNK